MLKPATRIKSFDCARGVAALIVLLYHIPLIIGVKQSENYVLTIIFFPAKFGEQAVYFFMALSGFVLASAYNKFGKLNLLTWSTWRLIRLLPMFYSTLILGFLLIPNSSIRFADLLHLYLFSNNTIYTGINPPLWSLSVEVLLSILLYPYW